MGALSLILGNRADTSALKDKNQRCLVEGVFISQSPGLKSLFIINDIDEDEQIILRREISPNGKSRSFVNDTPVSLQVIKDIGSVLVDIHSQHENLNLNSNLYQLEVIDVFADNLSVLAEYQLVFNKYSAVEKELTELKENTLRVKTELDFLEFQHNELEQAKLKAGEQEELEAEINILTHAEEIKSGLYKVWQLISGDEINSDKILRDAEQILNRLEKFHAPSASLRLRIESLIIEIKDIALETESMGEKVDVDPGRLEFVKDRLNLIYTLQQKHHIKTLDDLLKLKDDLGLKILKLNSHEFRMGDLEKLKAEHQKKMYELAGRISLRRDEIIPVIQEKVVLMLVQLGIPNARFEISNTKNPVPGINGIDNIRFLFTANRKTELQDISRVASGGELSRLMLSIKSLISGKRELPTIIFDEIDSGVSGEIAFKVGKIMKEMSEDRQVFSITHLPQVASKGDHHFLVFKNERESGTTTEIKLLNKAERLAEIAKMLSGEQTTEAAIANARELLG